MREDTNNSMAVSTGRLGLQADEKRLLTGVNFRSTPVPDSSGGTVAREMSMYVSAEKQKKELKA